MECRHGNFWIGLGIGSILGAVAYRRDAEAEAACAEKKAMNLGVKAVETGADIANKVAEEADKVAGKVKDKWEK